LATLYPPVVFASNAFVPDAVFWLPLVLFNSA
jgi:hypothetical protein